MKKKDSVKIWFRKNASENYWGIRKHVKMILFQINSLEGFAVFMVF